jgi:hypothetical protein
VYALMVRRLDPLTLRRQRPPVPLGFVASLLSVMAATGTIFALRHLAPVVASPPE